MNDKKMCELASRLHNISYLEWTKLKMAIDEYFRIKTREFERELKLSDDDYVQRAIRSRFG